MSDNTPETHLKADGTPDGRYGVGKGRSVTGMHTTDFGVRLCMAKKRQSNGECHRIAGWGTDHPGYGRCKNHGGSAPNGRLKAYKEMAMEESKRIMGPMIDIEPHDALLLCVKIAAGEVAYTTMQVENLEEAIMRPETDTEKSGEEHTVEHKEGPHQMHLWILVRQGAMERLAKFSKMALDAGIQERAVKLAEGQGGELANVLQGIFADLTLTEHQMEVLPDIIHKHLTLLEGSSTAVIEARGRTVRR